MPFAQVFIRRLEQKKQNNQIIKLIGNWDYRISSPSHWIKRSNYSFLWTWKHVMFKSLATHLPYIFDRKLSTALAFSTVISSGHQCVAAPNKKPWSANGFRRPRSWSYHDKRNTDLLRKKKPWLTWTIALRIIGPSYGGVWLSIGGFWDLQISSFEMMRRVV